MNNPILSIIIPTKNRYATLLPLLDALCSFESDNFEIVIQDNSDNNEEIADYLESNKDVRINYFYCSDKLSVIDNSDLAVNHTIGEYICFIGDDDGVMPYIVDVVEWMKQNGIKVLKAFKPSYYWPDQKSNYLSNNTSGNLKIKNFDYTIKKISTKKALDFTLNRGGTSMEMLPCLYHGIVERKVLEAIFEKCNTYFPGPSPDMANAIALTKFIDEYIYVDFPVAISGKSVKSTGGQGVLHKHISKIEDVSHLPKSTSKFWSNSIPKYWTGPTIWAESVLKAIENCEMSYSYTKFNYEYLYATLYVFNYENRKLIFKDFKHSILTFDFFVSYFYIFFNRVKIFFKNRFSPSIDKSNNINNIGEAIKLISGKVDERKLVFNVNKKE
jgi:glycosyltransferase involved in cell wall biosynthesis